MGIFDSVIGAGLGLLGLGQAKKAQSSADTANSASAGYYNQQVEQAKQAQANMNLLMPALYRQAGYDYTPPVAAVAGTPGMAPRTGLVYGRGQTQTYPGSPGTPGTPGSPASIKELPFQPFQDPNYAQYAAGAFLPLEKERQNELGAVRGQISNGIHQRGANADLVNQNIAEKESGANSAYYQDQFNRRQALQQYLVNILQGQMGAGQPAASGLAQAGQYAQGQANQQFGTSSATLAQAINQLLYHHEAGTGQTLANTAYGGYSAGRAVLGPPAPAGNVDTEANVYYP